MMRVFGTRNFLLGLIGFFLFHFVSISQARRPLDFGLFSRKNANIKFFSSPIQEVLARNYEESPNDTESSESGEEFNDRDIGSDDSSASLQFMITKRMRNVLIQDLGYLPSEVDEMEPQIAAVVIERSLRRPRRGMPASWRKDAGESNDANFLGNLKSNAVSVLRSMIDFTNNRLRPILPVLIVSSLVYFQRHSIIFLASSLLKSMRSVGSSIKSKVRGESEDDEEENYLSKPKSSPFSWNKRQNDVRNRKISEQTSDEIPSIHGKVDIKTYDQVVTQSWWEKFSFK